MKYAYTAILEPHENGAYMVTIPDIPGCVSYGDNLYEAVLMGTDAVSLMLTYLEEKGKAIPPASPPGSITAEAPSVTTILCADTEAYRKLYPPDYVPPELDDEPA